MIASKNLSKELPNTEQEGKDWTFFKHYMNFTKFINKMFTRVSGALILVIAILLFQDVIRRYFLNDPTSWALDISRFILVYVVFLSLAPALESGQHVTVDFLKEVISENKQRWMNIAIFLLVSVFGVILCWKLSIVTLDAFKDNRMFPVQTPVPVKYVYVAGPIGALQFTLTALSLTIKSIFFPAEKIHEE
ncbi:TRAP transporter small permease [Siminovitchia sediminis]|uniref:TRAP transporter small permease n=1 Tax=Siminovitchia sediminis TaxID=1274353 RepID=A0ABW4KL73_9BACI